MSQLSTSTNEVGNLLASVGQALLGHLIRSLDDNQTDLDSIYQRINRSLSARTLPLRRGLDGIGDTLLASLRAGTGTVQGELANVMSLVPAGTRLPPLTGIDPETGLPWATGHNPLAFTGLPAGENVRGSPTLGQPNPLSPYGYRPPASGPIVFGGQSQPTPTQQQFVDIWELPIGAAEGAGTPCYVQHGAPSPYPGAHFLLTVPLQAILTPGTDVYGIAACSTLPTGGGPIGVIPPSKPGQPPPPPPVTTGPAIPGSSCAHPLYIVQCSAPQPSHNGQPQPQPIAVQQWSAPPVQTGEDIGPGCSLTADGELPAVGSIEWCACLDQLVSWASAVANPLLTWLNSGNADALKPYLPQLPVIDFAPLPFTIDLNSILGDVIESGNSAISTLWQSIVTPVLQLGANIGGLLGIDLLRAIIRFLSRVRVGWDIGVWATTDISFTFPWLERLLEFTQGYVWQLEPPSLGDAIECYLQHTAPDSQIRCWTAMHSQNLDVYMPVIDARRDKLLTMELIEWGRRHDVPDDQIAQLMQSQGWFRLSEAQARLELYDQLPSIADHLHWLQRNVFDDQYVADYHLLDGFEDRFWTKFGHDLRSRGMRKEYAQLHYAAHWIQPAPTQMQEFLYRSDEIEAATGRPFKLDDYKRILAEQDYSALSRDWFAATAYRVPALGYIRDMYRANVFGDDQLKLYHQRLGYTAADSDNFVAVDRIHKDRFRTQQAHGWTPQAMAKAFAGNQLSADDVLLRMQFLGYTADEAQALMDRAVSDLNYQIFMRARSRVLSGAVQQVRQVLSVGVASEDTAATILTGIGFPADYASTIARLESTAAQVQRVRTGIQRVRLAYDSGEIDTPYARSLLATLHIVPDAVDSYLAVWSVERTPPRKRRSAGQIVKDVADGQMSIADALLRLDNLGYNDADSRLYLADAQAKIAQNEAKMTIAAERAVEKSRRELERIAREAQKQAKEIIALLEKEQSPKQLEEWAAKGLVNKDYFTSRLNLYGWDEQSINLHWESACAKKGSLCAPGPIEQTAQGASPSATASQPASATSGTSGVP